MPQQPTRRERMEKCLQEALNPAFLSIEDESSKHAGHAGAAPGGETHYRIEISATALEGLSRVAAHRTINDLLKPEFSSGLHALSLHIRTL